MDSIKQRYIYKLKAPNNKVYIGQTTNLKTRLDSYRRGNSKKQYLIYNSINKYGWENFIKEILFEGVVSKSFIDSLEIDLILMYKSQNRSLNIADGGNTVIQTEESIRKRSIPILVFNIDKKLVNQFKSISKCAEFFNTDCRNISHTIRDKMWYKKHYFIKLQDYDKDIIIRDYKKFRNKIIFVDKNNKEVIFNSIKEASYELKLSEKNIVYHCNRGKGKYNMRYG